MEVLLQVVEEGQQMIMMAELDYYMVAVEVLDMEEVEVEELMVEEEEYLEMKIILFLEEMVELMVAVEVVNVILDMEVLMVEEGEEDALV